MTKGFTLELMTNEELKSNLTYMMKWFRNMKVSDYIELSDRNY